MRNRAIAGERGVVMYPARLRDAADEKVTVKVLPGGHLDVFKPKSLRLPDAMREIRRKLDWELSPLRDDLFVRVTNKTEDYDFAKRGMHRGSRNYRDMIDEGGLSVAKDPEFPAKYAYLVRGKYIGTGTDGEPLIDLAGMKVESELMPWKEFRRFYAKQKAEHLKQIGWTQKQAREAFANLRPMDEPTFRKAMESLNPKGEVQMYTRFEAEGKTFTPVKFNPPLGDYARRVISGSDVYPPAQMAQIFVGLNVGPRKMITAEEVRDYIMQIRDKQLGSGVQHGGSVTPLLGWWRSSDDPRGYGLEDSVMIEILNIGTETEAKFKKNMQTIASRAARHFRQDAVVIRFWDEGQVSSSSLFYTEEAKASNPRRSPFPTKYTTQQERIYPEGAETDPGRHKALSEALSEALSRAITLAKQNGYEMDYTEGKMYVASAMQYNKDPLSLATLEWYFSV